MQRKKQNQQKTMKIKESSLCGNVVELNLYAKVAGG